MCVHGWAQPHGGAGRKAANVGVDPYPRRVDPDRLLALGLYVRRAADRLELRDWTFLLSPDPPDAEGDDDVRASVLPLATRQIATIKVCDAFDELPERQARVAIAHELAHCHTNRIVQCAEASLKDELAGAARHVLWENMNLAEERAVDALSEALAQLLPPIDWDHLDDDDAMVWEEDDGTLWLPPHRGLVLVDG